MQTTVRRLRTVCVPVCAGAILAGCNSSGGSGNGTVQAQSTAPVITRCYLGKSAKVPMCWFSLKWREGVLR